MMITIWSCFTHYAIEFDDLHLAQFRSLHGLCKNPRVNTSKYLDVVISVIYASEGVLS